MAIARALIKDPVVLLADEPTGNLDHKGGDEIFALLREQQEKRGCTLVVVTHDRRFIRPRRPGAGDPGRANRALKSVIDFGSL